MFMRSRFGPIYSTCTTRQWWGRHPPDGRRSGALGVGVCVEHQSLRWLEEQPALAYRCRRDRLPPYLLNFERADGSCFLGRIQWARLGQSLVSRWARALPRQ